MLGVSRNLADRFREHPALVLIFTNLRYRDTDWRVLGEPEVRERLKWREVSLGGASSHGFSAQIAKEMGFDAYIDHGSFDSWHHAELADELGVAAILGPREVMWPRPPVFDTDGQVHGTAWGFQQAGHPRIGFNTDAGVIAQEELPLQAAMGVRYGMDDRGMDQVRGVTIIPAVTAGIDERVGSLEPGKDADFVVVTGDPTDPPDICMTTWTSGSSSRVARPRAASPCTSAVTGRSCSSAREWA